MSRPTLSMLAAVLLLAPLSPACSPGLSPPQAPSPANPAGSATSSTTTPLPSPSAAPSAANPGARRSLRSVPDARAGSRTPRRDAPLPQRAFPGPDDGTLLLADVPPLLPIAEVAQPELKLAGLRFNPVNNAESRAGYYSALTLLDVATGHARPVRGVPADGRIRQPSWSPDGKHVAFTVARPTRVELWVVDVAGGDARPVGDLRINGAQPTRACNWLGDSSALVCRAVPADLGPAPGEPAVPTGPLVEQSTGKKTPAPTFQDLLHDEHDSALFEHYLTSEVWIVGLDGKERRVVGPAVVLDAETSPDATSVLVTSVHRPFSYHVTEDRFPMRTEVWDTSGKSIAVVADLPLAEDVPIDRDAERTGRRDIAWRPDAPASLWWVRGARWRRPARPRTPCVQR